MRSVLFLAGLLLCMACTSHMSSIHGTDHSIIINLDKNDFHISEQFSAEARTVLVLTVDWARLVNTEYGATVNGMYIFGDGTIHKPAHYALYQLISEHPGYDAVFYPRFETTTKRVPFLFDIIDVKVTARLGKLKTTNNE